MSVNPRVTMTDPRSNQSLPGELKHVTCAVDFSSASRAALADATRLAKEAGAALHLVHVDARLSLSIGSPEPVHVPAHLVEKLVPKHDESVRRNLEELVSISGASSSNVRVGDVVPSVLDEAKNQTADLLVLGRRGAGAASALMGNTSLSVARIAPCPVLVPGENHNAERPYRRVLVPIKDETEVVPLTRAVSALLPDGGEVELLHTWGGYWPERGTGDRDTFFASEAARSDEQKQLENITRRAVLPEGVSIKTHLATGRPADEILTRARESGADLVCLGTHPPTGTLERWLGNVAEKVMRNCEVSVLLVPMPKGP